MKFPRIQSRFKKSRKNNGYEIRTSKSVDTNEYFLKILEKKTGRQIVPKNRNKVDIIIPIYNSFEFVIKCVDSVLKNSDNCRIILIDDYSTDKRIEEFLNQISKKKKEDQELIVLKNSQNLGFIKTVNRGYSHTKNHFVILNSDTEVPTKWLDRLFLPIFENEDKIASVTPFSNSATICSFPNHLQNNPLFKGLDHQMIDDYFKKFGLSLCTIIPTGHGFCLAINKKVSDEIGFFDESFGKGFVEENDWCMRAQKKGYQNVMATDLFVFHNHGTSFGNEEKKTLLKENYQKLLQKHPDYEGKVNDFIKKDPLAAYRDVMSILIDNFTRGKNDLFLIITKEEKSEFNDEFEKVLGNLKKNPNILRLNYHSQDQSLFLSHYGSIQKDLMLFTPNPEFFVKKLIEFFEIDKFLRLDNIKKEKLQEIKKDELLKTFSKS